MTVVSRAYLPIENMSQPFAPALNVREGTPTSSAAALNGVPEQQQTFHLIDMSETSQPPLPPPRIQYGGHDRFELELEFVQMLSNPLYLQHLASQKLLDNEAFVAYLAYLQYFREPRYLRYLQYPGPTLRALELLQEERFRKEILIPDVVERMVQEGFRAATEGK